MGSGGEMGQSSGAFLGERTVDRLLEMVGGYPLGGSQRQCVAQLVEKWRRDGLLCEVSRGCLMLLAVLQNLHGFREDYEAPQNTS